MHRRVARYAGAVECERIIHLDDDLVVVDKPAGMLSVPGRGPEKADCLASRIQTRFADARVVHRLDMATSGLFMMARGDRVQRFLSARFAARHIHKTYLAIVAGLIDDDTGRIDLAMRADWPNRPRQVVDLDAGRPALTHWNVAERDCVALRSRVWLEPVTGRTHQLRVHLAAIGHPIVGDTLYAPPAVADGAQRLLLHAQRLALAHPRHGREVSFESPAPF